MKTWKTIAVTALSTLALSGAGFTAYQASQPAQYKGETFVNEKHTTTHSTNSNVASSSTNNEQSSASVTDSSSDNAIPAQSSSVEEQEQEQLPSAGHEARTFVTASHDLMNGQDMTYVVFLPTGECSKLIPAEDALTFCKYMNNIAGGQTTLNHSLDENYNYWKTNVKGQQQ